MQFLSQISFDEVAASFVALALLRAAVMPLALRIGTTDNG